MKTIKAILLIFVLNTCQYNYASQYMVTVDSLTKESYISPEMEWAVLSLNKPTHFVINRITGAAQNIPTVSDMLSNISMQLQTPHTITPEHKEVLKSALLAMLEATEIALTVVAIKLAYNNPEIEYSKDNLIMGLNAQKTNIIEVQKQVNAVNNQPSSYYSWMFGSSTPSKPAKLTYINPKSVPFDNNASTIAIPADLMPSIIQLHDYKQISDATLAANLLFKQCYIAQQQHRDNPIAINQQNPLNATNFLYTRFPNFYVNSYGSASYPICQETLKLGIDARLPLQQIRQAIQTALSIANKKFAGNLSSYLPQYFTSFLDGVLTQLMRYDEYIGNLCKIPMYGATPEDLAKAAEWSNLSKAAATVGTVAILAIAYHAGGDKVVDIALKSAGNNINWLGKAASDNASSLGKAVYGAATSDTTQKVLGSVATGVAGAAVTTATGIAKDTITEQLTANNASPILIQSTNKLINKLADNIVNDLEKKLNTPEKKSDISTKNS